MEYRKRKIQFKGRKGNLRRKLYKRYKGQPVQVRSHQRAQNNKINRIFDENKYFEIGQFMV